MRDRKKRMSCADHRVGTALRFECLLSDFEFILVTYLLLISEKICDPQMTSDTYRR